MRMEWKNHLMKFVCHSKQQNFKNHSIKYTKCTKNYVAASNNVYLKLSVAAWWSTVAYKTHAKYPYCEPVLLQSKRRTWYLHFSGELEVEVESVEKPKIYFSGKVYCRQEMDMIPAFSGELEVVRGRWLFMLQQEQDMNLYSFNKVSWFTGYDNKGQHFEKWRSATASFDNKT